MKKFLISTAAMIILGMFAACGGDTAGTDTPAAADTGGAGQAAAETPVADGPVTTVTVWFMGANVIDDTAVVAAANARLSELGLNIAINPIWTGGWGMGEPAQIALDTGDTGIDVFWTGSWGLNFWNNARVGNFIRLDNPDNNLIERYGQAMYAAVPQALWDAFTTDGPSGFGVYGIPGWKDYSELQTLTVNVERLTELGFDFDELFDMDGVNYEIFFDPVFEKILQASKDMYGDSFFPLLAESNNFMIHMTNAVGDPTGIAAFRFGFDPRNPALPVDPYIEIMLEEPRTMAVLQRLHHFWNSGFMNPRLAIPGDTVINESAMAGEFIFSTGIYAFGHTASFQAQTGLDIRFVPLARPTIHSVSAAGSGFAVSVYSQNQAAAVQFMNAWYTDNELAVILTEGVEGIHWNFNEEGLISLDNDARSGFAPWRFGMGNIFVLTPRDTDPGGWDYFDGFQNYNEQGIPMSTLGFTFNGEAVALEMAALQAVVDEFHQTVSIGAVDPVTAVPAYLEALRANGLDRVHEELNAQLQAFYAAR